MTSSSTTIHHSLLKVVIAILDGTLFYCRTVITQSQTIQTIGTRSPQQLVTDIMSNSVYPKKALVERKHCGHSNRTENNHVLEIWSDDTQQIQESHTDQNITKTVW